jgi:beta-glucosidase
VLEGIKNIAGNEVNILYARGSNISDDLDFAKKVNVFGARIDIDERPPEVMLQEAVSTARRADVVVAVVGEATEMSGESGNRTNLNVPEEQKKLIRALAQTGKPLVLVMFSGRPLTLEEENTLADAILQVWHPGVEAGNAIADVLFGDYNPSGKLTMTFPRNVGQIPIYYSHRNTGRPQAGDVFEKFKSNYLDSPNSPLFPFGYGLSYTTFEYSDVALSSTTLSAGGTLEAKVTVSNTGESDGEEVVQLYIRDVVTSITRPVKELKGFQKIFLKVGESKEVSFTLSEEDLKFYNYDLDFVAEPGEFIVFIGTSSVETNEARFVLE